MVENNSQTTAPNLSINSESGIRYGYRRFGNASAGHPPVVFLQHYRGNLDNWDPMFIDAIAAHREVIPVNYLGVGSTTGAVPSTVEGTAHGVVDFVDALGLDQFDLLGFSLGGFVAQEVALLRRHQVRRLVLAGTAPRGGPNIHGWSDDPQGRDWTRPAPRGFPFLVLRTD